MKWREDNIKKAKYWDCRKHLRKKYGMTPDQVLKMKQEQNYTCPICSRCTEDLVIDHNHRTNKFRGVICRKCNCAIGLLYDNSELCRMAAKYLDKHKD